MRIIIGCIDTKINGNRAHFYKWFMNRFIWIDSNESIRERWIVNECRGLLTRLISRRDAQHPFENIKAYFTYRYLCNYIKKKIIFEIWGRNAPCLWEKMATLPNSSLQLFLMQSSQSFLILKIKQWGLQHSKEKTQGYNHR